MFNINFVLNRYILAKIWEKIDSPEILILNGARQVGKTCLMKMLKDKLTKEKGVQPEQIHWYDLERVEDLSIWNNQETALAVLPLKATEQQYIFIDEFQKSKNIGSILKVLYDHYPHFKIIATGSASWYLTIDESLAGRKRVFSIWPLTFQEFLEWQDDIKILDFYKLALTDIGKTTLEMLNIINQAFLKFIIFGGYPAVVKAMDEKEKIAILSEIINSYILRDVQVQNYAANSLQVKKILTLLADRIGSLLEINNLALNSGLGRIALVNRLELLEKTFILNLVPPYFTNKTKELVKNPKIYLVDSGIRNILLANFSILPQAKEFGKIAENFTFAEIQKSADELEQTYFWRTKKGAEVDIIIKRGNELAPIEVKSGDETEIPLGLKSFIKQYQPKRAYVLNWSIIKDIKFNDTQILFRPIWFLFDFKERLF